MAAFPYFAVWQIPNLELASVVGATLLATTPSTPIAGWRISNRAGASKPNCFYGMREKPSAVLLSSSGFVGV